LSKLRGLGRCLSLVPAKMNLDMFMMPLLRDPIVEQATKNGMIQYSPGRTLSPKLMATASEARISCGVSTPTYAKLAKRYLEILTFRINFKLM
jgi:hypothetical protein